MKKILIPALLILSTSAAYASGGGSVMGNGGASEMTQLMNNTELVASVGHQSDMVANQIQQYILQQVQTKIAQQNMVGLPFDKIVANLGPYRNMVQPYLNALNVTTLLRDSAVRASSLMSGEVSAMTRLGMDPKTYMQNMIQISKERGGTLKQSLDNTTSAMQDVQKRGEALAQMHDQIPGIDSNIKGMQTLATSNMQMVGEMQNMNATLLQMKAQNEARGIEGEKDKVVSNQLYERDQDAIKAMGRLGGGKNAGR
ncbi:MAG: hypothetical protein M1547_03135 [Gammaproteobacteria bacterium]|nr:hypothetical protein [Gammaproteobacteria bacterium]